MKEKFLAFGGKFGGRIFRISIESSLVGQKSESAGQVVEL
jgi:hypothetical protein